MAPTPERIDPEVCEMSSLRRERVPDDCDRERTSVRVRKKHDIFLSHSGNQKDFVDQLCKDLQEAQLSPFFDQLLHCLPEGEEFAPLIFTAARECEVAVVVISDDYFYRTKWPMLELVAMVAAPACKIVPLFYKLKCKEFKNRRRQERWFQKWTEWADSDPLSRIDLEAWKKALKKLGGVKGITFVKEVGEVEYRKKVVKTVCELMQSQDMIIHLEECTSEGNQNPIQHPRADGGRFQRLTSKLFEWTMIICFPFWCAALLKLFMVKVMIIIIVLYVVLYTITAPIVRDTMECLLGSEHLNIESTSDRYRRHLD